MSETSSDAESSCGWTIISNEGSDIESLGPEKTLECGDGLENIAPIVEPELQDPDISVSSAGRLKERGDSLDNTLTEETFEEPLCGSGDVGGTAAKEHATLCSSSDLSSSDIVTFGDVKEEERAAVEEEPASNEELYLGTSSSSQYTFSAVETVFPIQQPLAVNSSSSEDEAPVSGNTVVRRRRLRKNTTCTITDPEEEAAESGHSEEEEEEKVVEELPQEEELQGEQLRAALPLRGQGSLNKCILLALVIAISMGFGHFYGTIQILERQKIAQHLKEQPSSNEEAVQGLSEDLNQSGIIEHLTGIIGQISEENQELKRKQVQIQAQNDELQMHLKQAVGQWNQMESQHWRLTNENLLLKSSLEREEENLLTLRQELGNLRTEIGDLENRGAGAESVMSENQKLKDELQEEKKLIHGFLSQREVLMAEAETLRMELDEERRSADQLRDEVNKLSGGSPVAEESDSVTAELWDRLTELERKLSFEQQRSDLWERLYVETKEVKAKGDTEPKVKKSKDGMIGKVKETFDAVKNSTKEFVHHHKEQIKKAKESVKENLRKFSDSVKSTFRHFKDTASTFMKRATGSSKRFRERDAKEPWAHKAHRPHQRHSYKSADNSFDCNHNTRKSGDKVREDGDLHDDGHSAGDCSGVFDCAYQESMSLFNKAMEPIRADEFHKLLQSYLQQEVDHFHHWKEVENFINNFFHNGVFIHDQMLFTDFVSGVEDYLEDMHEYHGLDDDVFEDLDEYVYRHFFGATYSKSNGPSRPFEGPPTHTKEPQAKQQRKQQRARPRPQRERKWGRSRRNSDRHMADVKIELGPMPFGPKY